MREIKITVTPPLSKKVEEEDDYREVWPTMLPDDEGVIPRIKATFFDAATYRPNPEIAPNLYNIIPDWGAPIEEKAVHDFELTGGCTRFNNDQTVFKMHYIGNDFLIPQEILNREFKDKDPKERWKRLPLHGPGFNADTNDQEERDDGKRWPMLVWDYNLRASLKKAFDAEPSFDCSPDLDQDGKTKGRGKVKDIDTSKPMEFNWKAAKSGRYGIKVEETGTKTMAHFLNKPDAETTNYTVEWLEPFGIYYCPFDTTDKDNVKVTREPRYDADEVDGKFIKMRPNTDIKVFLIPRQWAHYCRVGKHSVSETPVAQMGFSVTHVGIGYGEDYTTSSVCMCGVPDWEMGISCSDCNCWYGTEINCYGSYSSSGCVWMDWNWAWWGHAESGHYEWTLLPSPQCVSVEDSGSMWPVYGPCEDSGSGTVTTDYRADIYQHTLDIYIGLWWDRFHWRPYKNLVAGTPQDTEEHNAFTFLWMPSGGSTWNDYAQVPVDLVGDETFDDALTHSMNAGDEEKEAQKKIIGGFNSFHLYSGTPDVEVNVFFELDDTENSAPPFGLVWRSTPGCNEFPKGETYGTYFQFNDLYGLKNRSASDFWNLLTQDFNSTEFWQQYGKYSDAANDGFITNNVPYGMGLSPNKEGSLIGIVLLNDTQPYFIWRRTDEHFEEKLLKVSGDYDGHFVSFEGDANFMDDIFLTYTKQTELTGSIASQLSYFSGERRRLDKICRKVNSVSCRSNDKANWRYRATSAACWANENDSAEVELERPVYVVFSREAPFLYQANHHEYPRLLRQIGHFSTDRAEGDYWVYPS